MKKSYIALGLLALMSVACQNKDEFVASRALTVHGDLTKTTIAYEGDVSHLVWSEGDNVMYLTDDKAGLYDFGFQSAEVNGNSFTANISTAATADNKLLVVWPSSATALGSSDAVVRMSASVSLKSTDPFNGRLLPMVALTAVPQGKEVNVSYRPLASVLRVQIDTTGHSKEKLQSLTLTTAEQCVGNFLVSTTQEGGALYKGRTNILEVKVTDTPELKDLKYVYMVVAKGSYTGVKMDVKTDVATYTFEDGKMDVSAEDKGLFRLNLTLPAYEKPKTECFVKVTSAEEVTAGGKYLIASKKSDTQYYVLTPDKSDEYLVAKTLTVQEDGTILKTEQNDKYSVTLVTDDAHSGKFAIKCAELGSKPYLKAPGNVSEAVGYIGKFWYGDESQLATQTNCWWTITVSAEKTVIGSHEFKMAGEPTGRFGQLSYFLSGKFGVSAPETDAEEFADVVLLKLQEI